MQNEKQAQSYQHSKERIFFLSLIVNFAALFVFVFSGWSILLRDFSFRVSAHLYCARAVYLLLFILGAYLIQFLLNFHEGFWLEHKFHLSNQNLAAWFIDDLKKNALGFCMFLILVQIIYFFLDHFPYDWWIWAGVFGLFLNLFLAHITPEYIIPLFYKYSSIANQDLREALLRLFERAGMKIKDAFVIDFSSKTKKANAFICGLGKSRRVVLTDNLIKDFTIPEIETVVAHEIGHYKNHDILKTTVVNSSMTFLSFYLLDRVLLKILPWVGLKHLNDIASLPMMFLVLTVFGLLTMPLLNSYNRSIERSADRFCLQLTQRPDDFISMMKKIGEKNLAEFVPSRFKEILFYSHPPIQKRITFAEGFAKSK